ncbi:MAG: hypothetical protein AAGC67_16425 [Myxococcota bacterium]
MQTVLLVAAGVVLGVLLLGVLAIGYLKSKIGSFCEAISELVRAGGIPPFRVQLDANAEIEWRDEARVSAATADFEAHGYARIGDFDVREMDDVRIRAMWNREHGTCVVFYDHPEMGLWADAFQEFVDGTSVTVSTSRETGMDTPFHARLFRLESELGDAGVARALHDRLLHESIGCEPMAFRPEDFASVYAELYAQEMDWRIARGGVTRGEIERVVQLSGGELPSEAQIELIQEMWRDAIAFFIDEEVRNAWLADCDLSAIEWDRLQDRIRVVHERHKSEDLVDDLAWEMVAADADKDADYDDEAACEASRETLRPCFETSNRQGFARAQTFLPEKHQYEKLGSTEDPWPADIWAAPEPIE